MGFRQSVVFSKRRTWGCALSCREEVRERRDALLSLGPLLRGGDSRSNRTLSARKPDLQAKRGLALCSYPQVPQLFFPVKQGSEKVRANIYFPLRRIKIFSPARSHYFSNVRTCLLVFRKSTRERLPCFGFGFYFKQKNSFRKKDMGPRGKVLSTAFCPYTCERWQCVQAVLARTGPPLPSSGPTGQPRFPP